MWRESGDSGLEIVDCVSCLLKGEAMPHACISYVLGKLSVSRHRMLRVSSVNILQ